MRVITSTAIAAITFLNVLTGNAAIADDWKPVILDSKSDIKEIIDEFGAQLSALIAQAGGEVRVSMVRAYQLSDSLISSMKVAYGDSVKLTFGELDKQQQKTFADMRDTLDYMHNNIHSEASRAFNVMENFNAILADILSWNKDPMVIDYTPAYIPPENLGHDVKIVITGQRLHKIGVDTPTIQIAGATLPAAGATDTVISFVVPHSLFGMHQSGTAFSSARLIIYRPVSSWWDWVPGRTLKQQAIPFSLLFTALPEELGVYSTEIIESESAVDRQKFQQPQVLSATKNGGGGKEVSDCYTPKEGYHFDLYTAKLIEDKHTAYKDNDTSPGTNSGGIYYKDGVKGIDRICVAVLASTGCTECGATTEGHLEVDMVKPIVKEADPKVSAEKPLLWEDNPIPLAKDAVTQLIHIKVFNEIPRVFSLSEPSSMQFIEVKPDPRDAVTILHPLVSGGS